MIAVERDGWAAQVFGSHKTIWAYTRNVTEWSNASLGPPAPHALQVFAAAARDQAIADELVENFAAPARSWAVFGSPDGAAAFLARFGRPAAA
jgi:hypothetical protein